MSGKRPIVEYGVVVSRKQGLTAMTAAERQAVRRAALEEAARVFDSADPASASAWVARTIRALADEPGEPCKTCGGDGFVTRCPGDEHATEHAPCHKCALESR